MKIHNLTQGSQEWLAYRAQHFNASDAPAMMGCSPYKTRAELLREMHTGLPAEVDAGTQKRFDNGHRAEALARPLAEQIIGEELYPVVGSERVAGLQRALSASFDGLTLDESEGFEHKALNDELRAAFRAIGSLVGGGDDAPGRLLPIYHRVQMEQQLLVSGAGRILFMTTEWDADGNLVGEHECWYYPDHDLREQIVRGWAQFEKDLAAYIPQPAAEPVTAAPVESLPVVAVRMDGALVVQSNLPAFGQALRIFVDRIPKRPSTDQEFADTEAACKALKRAEEALDAAEANALASLSDVEAMRRMVADFRNLARDTRLASEKMVERRKVELKESAVLKAREALALHVEVINAEIAPHRLQPVAVDFAGAIKGKRSVTSMQDALDTTLAAAKIAADGQARAIRANVAAFKAKAAGFEHLFADLATLVHKPESDFAPLVDARIATHRAAEERREQERQAAEAKRIAEAEERARQQEAARIAAEQAAAAEAQRQQQAAAEEAQRQATAAQQSESLTSTAKAAERVGALIAGAVEQAAVLHPHAVAPPPAPKPRADEPATLNLGTICGRLGFTVNAAFLADTLHVRPAATDKRASLYTESQFLLICRQLQAHISAVAEMAGEPA